MLQILTEKSIAETLLLWQSKLETVDRLSQLVAGWKSSLEQGVAALRSLPQHNRDADNYERQFREAQLSLPGMGFPNAIEVVDSTRTRGRRRKDGRKPDVQIIEEIFRECGPLHVTDLIPRGQSRGVSFKGKKKPTLMARDKMLGSKRFHLFGKNVWGLPGQELPRKYAPETSTPQLAHGGESLLP